MPELRSADESNVKFKNNVLPFPSLQAAPRDPPPARAPMVVAAIVLFAAAIILGWIAIRALVG